MPGRVVRLLVAENSEVEAGQGIVVVEAMKMQNEIKSPKKGVVKKISGDPRRGGESRRRVGHRGMKALGVADGAFGTYPDESKGPGQGQIGFGSDAAVAHVPAPDPGRNHPTAIAPTSSQTSLFSRVPWRKRQIEASNGGGVFVKLQRIISFVTLAISILTLVLVLKRPAPVAPAPRPPRLPPMRSLSKRK